MTKKYNDKAIADDTKAVSNGNDACRRLLEYFLTLNDEKPVEAFVDYWKERGKWQMVECNISAKNPTGERTQGFHAVISGTKKGSIVRRNAITARSMSSMFSNDKAIARKVKQEAEKEAQKVAEEAKTPAEKKAEEKVMAGALERKEAIINVSERFQSIKECLEILNATQAGKLAMMGHSEERPKYERVSRKAV